MNNKLIKRSKTKSGQPLTVMKVTRMISLPHFKESMKNSMKEKKKNMMKKKVMEKELMDKQEDLMDHGRLLRVLS